MNKKLGLFAVLAFAGAITSAFAVPNDYATWPYYKNLILNTKATGAGVAVTQTQFPVLIKLTSTNFDWAKDYPNNGKDIRFAKASNGTHFPYEIDQWDSTNHVAAIWVLVDSVFATDSSASHALRMFWGKSGVADSSDTASGMNSATQKVFAPSNGYLGVYHMGNPTNGNAQTGVRPNAVGPGTNDATPHKLKSTTLIVNGVIGKADTLDRCVFDTLAATNADSNGRYFSLGTYPLGTFVNKNMTISGWHYIFAAAATGLWQAGVSVGNVSISTNGKSLNAVQMGRANVGTAIAAGYQNCPGIASTNPPWISGNTGFPTGNNSMSVPTNWRYEAISIKSGKTGNDTLFINGVRWASSTATNDSNIRDTVRTGNRIGVGLNSGDSTLHGAFDEIRIANVSRSTEWIKLEYKNQQVGVSGIDSLSVMLTGTMPTIAYGGPFIDTSNQSYSHTPSTLTGSPTSCTASPSLPAGLSISPTTCVISGTPSVTTSTTVYTISATNGAGSAQTQITLTTVVVAPTNLSYSTPSTTYKVGTVITSNTPTVTGTASSYSINPDINANTGLTFNTSTGVLSGTPTTVSFPAVGYTVTATNTAGSTPANITIGTQAAPAITVQPLDSIVLATNPTSMTVTATGTSLSYQWKRGGVNVIDTVSGRYIGSTASTLNITNVGASDTGLYTCFISNLVGNVTTNNAHLQLATPPAYAGYTNNATYTATLTAVTNNPGVSGNPSSCTASPALPLGLTISNSTCTISGTPTRAKPSTLYTITGSNVAGSTQTTVTFTVADTLVTITSQPVVKKQVALNGGTKIGVSINALMGGDTVVTYTWQRRRKSGVTDTIQNTPNSASATDSLVALTNLTALDDSARYTCLIRNPKGVVTSGNDTVFITPIISYTNTPVIYNNTVAITNNTPTSTGGSITSCSSAPTLPTGLSFVQTSCAITGTPTSGTLAATNYVVTPVGPGGTGATATINIAIAIAPTAVTQPVNQPVKVGGVAKFKFTVNTTNAPLTYKWVKGPLFGGSDTVQTTLSTTDV